MPVSQRPVRAVSLGAFMLGAVLCGCGGGGGSPYGGGGYGGSGGNGGGSYPPSTPSSGPTNGPTAVPTACASPTAAPATGDAVFPLGASCNTANTQAGYTIAGDASGLVIAASTADESLTLAAGAAQSPPPSGSIEIDLTAGETASAARRRATKAPRSEADLRSHRSVAALAPRRFAHARPVADAKLASLLFAGARGAAVARKRSILPTTVGSTAGIWTLQTTSTGSRYVQVASTLEYASTYGDIWVDNSLLATQGGPLTTTAIQTIGSDYDNAWSAVTPVVGSPDYSSSSPGAEQTTDCSGSTTPIFIPDPDDRQAVFVISSASNGGFGSYFDPSNLVYDDVATQCLSAESNERSGVYVQYMLGSAADTLAQQLAEDDVVLPANDLAHLIDFVGHSITNPGTGNDTFLQTGYIDTPFIIEGLASLSEDFAIHRMYPQMTMDVDDNGTSAQAYLSDPAAYSLTAFYGTDPGESAAVGCNGCFGSAYLFARYAYDRFGARYPSAVVTSGLSGYANLANAFGATTSPENVIGDFSVAMAVSGQGYTTDPRYDVANFTTFGTYADQSGASLTLAGPTASTTQNAGTDETYAATGGAFLYVQLGGLPSAQTIQVTDGTGRLGLESALSQH